FYYPTSLKTSPSTRSAAPLGPLAILGRTPLAASPFYLPCHLPRSRTHPPHTLHLFPGLPGSLDHLLSQRGILLPSAPVAPGAASVGGHSALGAGRPPLRGRGLGTEYSTECPATGMYHPPHSLRPYTLRLDHGLVP